LQGERDERGKRLKLGVAAHGFGYLGGFVGAGSSRACPAPLDPYRLMDLAADSGLSGVEIPVEYLEGRSDDELARIRRNGQERGLHFVVDSGVVEEAGVREAIRKAKLLGAFTLRVTASNILCGDRRALASTWPGYMAEIADRLRAVSADAEEAGVDIAVENHQDLTSGELVHLCREVGSARVGVNLDAVNPLAVAEEPLEFALRVAPLIKHVHLKDYRVYKTPEGYRLVRCPIGAGVLDVRGLFAILSERAPGATVAIELAALEGRHVRFMEEGFWQGYPARRFEEVLPALRVREEKARPEGEEWRTPWELGADHRELSEYEMVQFRESVAFLRGL
jgi:sugar phosphate isomerase/epimerase